MDKAQKMRKLFSHAPRDYDTLLSRLTLRSDSMWRRRVIEASEPHENSFILDVATGTGLMAFNFAHQLKDEAMVVGIDICEPMIRKANDHRRQSKEKTVEFVAGQAEALPFMDGCFDCATITLALRNVTDPKLVFQEMNRVVRRGGSIVSLDFSRPNVLFRPFYYFHIFCILPLIGRLVSKRWMEIFDYLALSIKRSLSPRKIGDLMRMVGLSRVTIRRLSMGTITLVSGIKD